MKYIMATLVLFSLNAAAENYDWPNNDNTMNDWSRQNHIYEMQMQNQRMIEQQNRQMQEINDNNYRMQQQLHREQVLKNGQGRPNSLANEIYK